MAQKKSAQVAKLKAESKARRDRPASRRKFHLDKRAAAIAAAPGDDDELLTTAETAAWLQVSVQWLDIGRSGKGYGPPYVKLGDHIVRYHRGRVREWLRKRTFRSTSEYARRRSRRRGTSAKKGKGGHDRNDRHQNKNSNRKNNTMIEDPR
jgi:hypothetical protein